MTSAEAVSYEPRELGRTFAIRHRERLILLALLGGTAIAYLWGLGVNGYSNEFYAMAIQSGSESWKAWFFGSLDPSNAITVDKTPASLWLMGLSGRIFGFSTLSMLIPQALLGVATVGTVYACVRRVFSTSAAVIAGVVLATTPVAAMMFRFNNPDAMLVFLMAVAAYAVMRAAESPRRALRWLLLAGALIGFAFLAKMLQAFLVLPGFVAAYLVAGYAPLGRRFAHLLGAFAAMIVAGGWWIAIVEMVPASARPYIGGSQHNSILELTLGYNGFGRLNGNEAGSVGGGGGPGGGNGGGMWGETGLFRMFGSEIGSQISWLLPAALVGVIVLAVLTWRAERTDRRRVFLLVWGGWLVVTTLTFSLMAGIFHAYYTVALAPAIGAMTGVGVVALWRRREDLVVRATLAGTVGLTAAWSWVLLDRTSDWHPWLRYVVAVAGVLAVLLIVAEDVLAEYGMRRIGHLMAVLVAVVAFTGPVAYTAQTIGTAHTGSIPSAGPSGGGMGGGPGGGGGAPRGGRAARGDGGGTGGAGFLGGGGTSGVGDELVTMLKSGDYKWAAATQTANGASPLALASDTSILAIGGFNGTDPYPSLAQFKKLVAAGDIHYYVAQSSGGMRGGPGGQSTSSIANWVEDNYSSTTVGNYTVYDLTGGSSS